MRRCSSSIGFTLLETALALVIMALVVSAMIYPMQAQVETRFADETQKTLDEAREALLGFISVNGYFPCPADATSNGQEAAGADHDTGACPTWYGFLPAAALGMVKLDSQGYAIDAWGRQDDTTGVNRIRYAITNQTVQTITNAYTSENGLASIAIDSIDSVDLLYVCGSATGVVVGSNCGTASVLTTRAPVVIWSVGGNARTGGTNADEAENPNPNGGSADRIFVSRTRSQSTATEFDDAVTWIPIATIMNRLLGAGHVPQ